MCCLLHTQSWLKLYCRPRAVLNDYSVVRWDKESTSGVKSEGGDVLILVTNELAAVLVWELQNRGCMDKC